MKKLSTLIIALACTAVPCYAAQGEVPVIKNPVLWADVPDPDVISVGDDFYMVSTTMHLMPGCPIMHSRDLKNWEVISYVFDRLEDTPYYDMDGGTVYGKGQWATSLRYHGGKFYVLFSPNDNPYRSYIYSATDPAGKWELVSRTQHFHDSSFLFDDDGKVYVYSGGGDIRLRELNPDLSDVKEGGIDMVVIHPDSTETGLHEGSRAVKHDGKYYLLVISWPAGEPRRQLCYRADNITGPYEKKVILESTFGGFPYVGQGAIFDDSEGNWWGMIFQDRGGVGRVPTLNPCRWIDGWPILGDENGRVPETITGFGKETSKAEIVSSDDFSSDKLNINWEWNHNPVDSLWSLTERPGYLRLHTGKVVGNMYEAHNTIGQRMEGPRCEGVVKLDLAGMADGDVAGFGAFNGHSALLSVRNDGGKKSLVYHNAVVNFKKDTKVINDVENTDMVTVPLEGDELYLRISADFRPGTDIARFAYSLNGNDWTDIPDEYKMRYDWSRLFMGTRFAIYNYATKQPGGYVDVDYFAYDRRPE